MADEEVARRRVDEDRAVVERVDAQDALGAEGEPRGPLRAAVGESWKQRKHRSRTVEG